MNDKRQERFEEFSRICITNSEFEGIKLFMEVEELIKENKNAFEALEKIINDYHAHESGASTETKFLMLINKWEAPFIACTELVKRIETNETMFKNVCKARGTTLKKIGYISVAGKARELLQEQRNK
jgi:hypothetical protein